MQFSLNAFEIKDLLYKQLNIKTNTTKLNCHYFYYVNKQLKTKHSCTIKLYPHSIYIESDKKNFIKIRDQKTNALVIDLKLNQISFNKSYYLKKDTVLSNSRMLIYYYKENQIKFLQIYLTKKELILSFEYGKFVIRIE
ncbi:MAG: hypothetical protein KatS3mg129_3199 [Leptospiraceae bacterium]|nr:MAG: hypothetical protein KatS3mg129_3199 [Leptospiraceae bacterium]